MNRPAPYPPDVRAKGWRFELDVERIEQSDTWALASVETRPWLLMLWMTAWKQTPCGSLPNDDALIAARIGVPLSKFGEIKASLMRGWWLADDGRQYHDTMVERVEAMQEAREKERSRKAGWRREQNNGNVPRDTAGTPNVVTLESQVITPGVTAPEPEPEPVIKEEANASLSASRPAAVPPCPVDRLIDLYEAHLPVLPKVRRSLFKKGESVKAMRARWHWVMTSHHERGECAGQRLAETEDEGVAWFDRFFAFVAESVFLTGRKGGWAANLRWLLQASNFEKVLSHEFHYRGAA